MKGDSEGWDDVADSQQISATEAGTRLASVRQKAIQCRTSRTAAQRVKAANRAVYSGRTESGRLAVPRVLRCERREFAAEVDTPCRVARGDPSGSNEVIRGVVARRILL